MEDRERIKELYGSISQRRLAAQFGVSRRLVIFIGCPEKYKKNLLNRELRGGSMHYYSKEKQKDYVKEHRRHKQILCKKNLLEDRMIKRIQWRTYLKKYKPVKNTINSDASFEGYMFETYDGELEALKELVRESMTKPSTKGLEGYRVWTIVDGTTNGRCYLLNGWHLVNRIGYVFCEVPWVEGDEIISTI
jgi:hypothetical protein